MGTPMRTLAALPLVLFALLAGAARAPAGDAPAAAAVGTFEHFRRVRIAVSAGADQVGKLVSITDAGGGELGIGRLIAGGQGAVAVVVLPMPPIGKPYRELSCLVSGCPALRVQIPDADAARRAAFAEAPVAFRSAVFSGAKFPRCDFREPNLIEDLVGGYTLATTFFDAAGKEVAEAGKVGRYGAMVVAQGADGALTRRFLTLFRTEGEMKWRDAEAALSGLALPAALGLEPMVLNEQAGETAEFLKGRLAGSGDDGQPAAQLLAWLHEEKPGAGRATFRDSPAESDARWWFAQKKRLGLITHRYLSFLPKDYQDGAAAYPLILFLHGSGERGLDVEEVRKHGPHKYLLAHDNPFIIIEPQCDPGQWWHACAVDDLLDEVCAKFRVDRERIYLTGLSMGGFGTWATAGESPERFAAAVPICGRGDPREAARMKDLPIWAFHGAKDPTVPVKNSIDMVDALSALGGRVKLTIYPEAQHDSWTEAYNTPELYQWLLRQRLGKPEQPAGAPR
jgi:predicted esterase